MDGFNIIPEDVNKNVENKMEQNPKIAFNVDSKKVNQINSEASKIEQKADSVNVQVRQSGSLYIYLSLAIFIGSIGYSIFLLVQKQVLIQSIKNVSEELKVLESKINKSEIESLKVADEKLKIIKQKLASHVISSDSLGLINQNIRTSSQVTEYKFDLTDSDIILSFSAIVPSFKDIAEQTERLFEMRKEGKIKSFGLSNLSYEQDTKRVRFTVKVNLDKSKFSADSRGGVQNNIK
jgi:hypothetical protein